jgi:5-hydroxyisourate hydrolase
VSRFWDKKQNSLPLQSNDLFVSRFKEMFYLAMVRCKITHCRCGDELWLTLSRQCTDQDGRVERFMLPGSLTPGTYRVKFETAAYYTANGGNSAFYPQACVDFEVTTATARQHFHIPLLLSPFAYNTYRGS